MTTAHAHTEDDQVPDPLDSPAAERRSAVRAALARWGAQAAYLAPSFPLSLAAFLLSWTLALTGAALVIVWVGLAILVAALLCARGFATLE
ncbi:MAG: sensor domain-containing protein, partial [Propioniciclava sp.]